MSKYSQVPTDTFKSIVPGAGVLATEFDPTVGTLDQSKILGATNGGINFSDGIAFRDYANGIDNVPKNTKEFKRIDNSSREIKISGTFKSANKSLTKQLMAAADISGNKITPRSAIASEDFFTLWAIFDYSDENTGENAGNLAIKIKNALHTGGFKLQSQNEDLANFAFEFMAHYSINDIDNVPYEIYIRDGGDPIPSVNLNAHYGEVEAEDTLTLTATTVPAGETVTWSSSDTSTATVSGGVVTGVAAGSCIITAAITKSGVTYNDTCTVVVTAAES